jgi:hypothetical protein
MRKSLSLIAFAVLGASMMYGQASRTWVSGVGDDANPCSRTAPCKTWAGAISKTAPGGEIDALDPGGFGALTITKSITLDGGGGQVASTLVSGTNGIVVLAGASDVVTIRNVRINGLLNSGNAGINGIRFLGGKALNVENCVIFGFSQNGIDIALNQNTQAEVHIFNTTVSNVSADGIRAANAQGPPVAVSIDNAEINLAAIGVEGAQHSRVHVRNSYIHSSGTNGVKADDAVSTDAQLEINDSIVNFSFGGDAIQASTGGTIVTGRMTVFNNGGCGFNGTGGGAIVWWQNTNQMGSNSANVCGTNTPINPQI